MAPPKERKVILIMDEKEVQAVESARLTIKGICEEKSYQDRRARARRSSYGALSHREQREALEAMQRSLQEAFLSPDVSQKAVDLMLTHLGEEHRDLSDEQYAWAYWRMARILNVAAGAAGD